MNSFSYSSQIKCFQKQMWQIRHNMNIFLLFWYVELMPEICLHLSVTPFKINYFSYRVFTKLYNNGEIIKKKHQNFSFNYNCNWALDHKAAMFIWCSVLWTCLLKARIAEPEETAVAREWLCKHLSMATTSDDHNNRHTNITIKELLETVLFCVVHANIIWGDSLDI
jgi:hypothetical protein